MKGFKLYIYVLLSLLLSPVTLGQFVMQELIKNNVSPAYQKEDRLFSTLMNGKIYTVTREMGHVYSIDPNKPEIVEDYGSVYSSIYATKYPGGITNDGRYLYGIINIFSELTSPNTYLYKMDTANRSNPYEIYQLRNPYESWAQPKIIQSNDKVKRYKYALFGGWNIGPSKPRFIKWNISLPDASPTDITIDDDDLDGLNGIEIIETGTYKKQNVAYFGISKLRENHLHYIIVYDVENRKVLKKKYIKDWNIINMSVDAVHDGVVWLFQRDSTANPITIYRYDFLDSSYKEFWSGFSWPKPYNRYYFASYGNYIYTNCAVINTIDKTITGIKINDTTIADMNSLSILYDDSLNIVYGVERSDNNDTSHFYKVSTPNNPAPICSVFNLDDLPFNKKKRPQGGFTVSSLAAYNGIVRHSIKAVNAEIISYPSQSDWQIKKIGGGTYGIQADKILVVQRDNNPVYLYGLYSGPFIRIVKYSDGEVNLDSYIDLHDYFGNSLSKKQVRIHDMIETNDGNIVLATSSGAQFTDEGNSAYLIGFNLNEYLSSNGSTKELIILGKTTFDLPIVNCDEIHHNGLNYRFLTNLDRHQIMGTVSCKLMDGISVCNPPELSSSRTGLFIFDFPKNWNKWQKFPEVNPINIKIDIPTDSNCATQPTAICYYNGKYYVAENFHLWVYNEDVIINSNSFVFDTSGSSGSIIQKKDFFACIDYYFNNPWQLMNVNGTFYCYSRGALFRFNENSIKPERYIIPGYNKNTDPAYEITCLTNDIIKNKIYAGTLSGRIYYLSRGVNGIKIPESILNNYPNPFNPTTTINYSIPYFSKVSIKVFDILGREVVELINQEQEEGLHSVVFNASKLSSGVYFYRIEGNGFSQVNKMILCK